MPEQVEVMTTMMCVNPAGAPTHREFSDEDYQAMCGRYSCWYPIENNLIKTFDWERGWRIFRTVAEALM